MVGGIAERSDRECRQVRGVKKKEGEQLTAEGLIGLAVGRFGLGYRETLLLRPEEFEEIARRWHERQEHDERQAWERMRLHAVMTLQPHSSRTLRPDKLLPLPWDKVAAGCPKTDTTLKPPAAQSTPEAFRKAIEAAGQS